MLVETGHAAKAADTVLLIFIDDLQHVRPDQFAVLISALHHCAHLKLPLTIVGAGLPQLLRLAGEARSYAERLFDYPWWTSWTTRPRRMRFASRSGTWGLISTMTRCRRSSK
ncbi:MAG: hypothetical protein LH479_08615 [Polaromonas sp.]|nr:hypothetical protein [Polaromonas sp.]